MSIKSVDSFPTKKIQDGKYFIKFVETEEELDQVLKLRFEIFNLELGEGLEKSYETGRDEDDFDKTCHHLMAINEETGKVIGTYRMQTMESAEQGSGFYSASEFDFSFFPKDVLKESIELGRACVSKDERSMTVLNLLLKGVVLYLSSQNKRYIFGCTSITSQDVEEGKRAMQYLKKKGFLHPQILLPAKPELSCYQGDLTDDPGVSMHLPPLFAIYMRLGTRIISAPAIDRYFKTIDFLMLFDVNDLSAKNRDFFFDFSSK